MRTEKERLEHYKQRVHRFCQRIYDVDLETQPVNYIEDEERRFKIWYLDSLYVGLSAAINQDKILALRCLLQVRQYEGRCVYPDKCDGSDIVLQHYVEDLIKEQL